VDADAVDVLENGQPMTAKRAKTERFAREEAERISAVVERARRPGYDPTVTVRHVEPEVKPPENIDCAGCGHPFLIGEGKWRDPDRHGLHVHTKGGCERARSRLAARKLAEPVEEPAPVTPAPRPPVNAREAGKRNQQAILVALAEHGEMQQAALAAAAGVPGGSIAAVVKRLADRGQIVRREAGAPGGPPTVLWRLADAPAPEPASPEPEPAVLTVEQAAADVRRQDGIGGEPEPIASPPEPEPEPDEDATAFEWLTARYVTALIASIERASVLRGEAPPEHVFDRIERILGISEDHPTNEGNGRAASTP
jgi:hypothetical protein